MDRIDEFLHSALEASIYVAPRDHGLTLAELVEVAGPLRLFAGQISDALRGQWEQKYDHRSKRYRLDSDSPYQLSEFHWRRDPDPRNPEAFEFVLVQLQEIARHEGQARARLDRGVLLARGFSAGLPEEDLEIAVELLRLAGRIEEKEGVLALTHRGMQWPLPSKQRQQAATLAGHPVRQRELLAQVLPLVRTVLGRRIEGRPPSAEPLTAFEHLLTALGHSRFRSWWVLTRAELVRADPALQPTTVCVLAAALTEGALSFVLPFAQATTGAFPKQSEADPRTWKLEHLVNGARAGADPLLSDALVARGRLLNTIRQRIHVGRLLVGDYGANIDTQPEEAREARSTVDLIVGAVVGWLSRHPPPPSP